MARPKKQTKAKEPIRIRFKKLQDGNKSIYLDTYVGGKREYEFLKMYLIPEVDNYSRTRNANTMRAANAIKAQRIIELANGKAGVNQAVTRSKMLLFDWIEEYKIMQLDRGYSGFLSLNSGMSLILDAYMGKDITLAEIDKQYCLGFIDFLKKYVSPRTHKKLSSTTIKIYCTRFNALLNMAVKEDLITENPFSKIRKDELVKDTSNPRQYLTIDEVKALVATPCRDNVVKSAFMFSCCCGLRISDVKALTWGDIKTDNGNCRVEIVVKKTRQPLYLPLSKEATKWLPERGNADDGDKVFALKSYNSIGSIIKSWAKKAGITKCITYHISRHTFATTLLTQGADLFSTSKLLGHSNVSTTQIYAKIIDQKKVDAVNLLDNVFTD